MLRIRGFQYNGKWHDGPVRTARVVYVPQASAKGIVIQREGAIQLDPAGTAEGKLLETALERFFPARVLAEPWKSFKVPDTLASRLEVRDGWVTFGLSDTASSPPQVRQARTHP